MKILFIGMPYSIHTARWISQLTAEGWDIYLFPSLSAELHSSFSSVNVFAPSLTYSVKNAHRVRCIRWTGLFAFADRVLSILLRKPVKLFWKWALILIIHFLKPDLVQSLEIQHAGYFTMTVRDYFPSDFPKWIVTNWGSDIYLFGRFPEHAARIKPILETCDYYSAECYRDVELAREMGFKGKALTVFPNAGGFDLEHVKQLREPGNTSARKVILLKGYQHWAGRALVGIRALAMCADALQGYTVAIYAATPDVEISANLFSQDTGIPVEFIPPCSHEEMLRWYGRARVYIGLSISDAISTSMLEAVVMGAFPIQSNTSCANEWISHGSGGFIVPAEDPEIISKAIREAVLNDSLVDNADEINKKLAYERLDEKIIKPQVIAMYKEILAERG
jgi:glycosyltransferase involved in cell wall biosynthesis